MIGIRNTGTITWVPWDFWGWTIGAASYILVRWRAYSRIRDSIKADMFCTINHWKALFVFLITLAGNKSLHRRSSCCWLVGSLRWLITTRYFKAALKMFSIFQNGGSRVLWLLRGTSANTSHWGRKRCHLMISHIRRYLLGCLIGEIERRIRACVLFTMSILIVNWRIKHRSRFRRE